MRGFEGNFFLQYYPVFLIISCPTLGQLSGSPTVLLLLIKDIRDLRSPRVHVKQPLGLNREIMQYRHNEEPSVQAFCGHKEA